VRPDFRLCGAVLLAALLPVALYAQQAAPEKN